MHPLRWNNHSSGRYYYAKAMSSSWYDLSKGLRPFGKAEGRFELHLVETATIDVVPFKLAWLWTGSYAVVVQTATVKEWPAVLENVSWR